MRQAIVRSALALGFVAAWGCRQAGAQWTPLDAYRRVAGELTQPPEMVVLAYLQRRQEITGLTPTVYLCPSLPAELREASFRSHLTSRARVADRILTASECDPDMAMTAPDEAAPADRRKDRIWILSLRQTRDTTELVATARPAGIERSGKIAPIHSERLLWDHARDIGGQSLIFERFRPWPH